MPSTVPRQFPSFVLPPPLQSWSAVPRQHPGMSPAVSSALQSSHNTLLSLSQQFAFLHNKTAVLSLKPFDPPLPLCHTATPTVHLYSLAELRQAVLMRVRESICAPSVGFPSPLQQASSLHVHPHCQSSQSLLRMEGLFLPCSHPPFVLHFCDCGQRNSFLVCPVQSISLFFHSQSKNIASCSKVFWLFSGR